MQKLPKSQQIKKKVVTATALNVSISDRTYFSCRIYKKLRP